MESGYKVFREVTPIKSSLILISWLHNLTTSLLHSLELAPGYSTIDLVLVTILVLISLYS